MKPSNLSDALEAYFVGRLNNARANGDCIDHRELKAMIDAYESGIFHATEINVTDGSVYEKAPPGELDPATPIQFDSPWLRGVNGQIRG